MAGEIQLRVLTPRRAVLDEAVHEVTAPGTAGEFGVLPNHATFLSSLEVGRLSFHDGSRLRHLAVREGFAEVSDNIVTVLVDAAEPAEDIDVGMAQADLVAAEDRIGELSPVDPAYNSADAERRWAQTRIEVATKQPSARR